MNAALHGFIDWWSQERICLTLEFGGGLLFALEYIALVLGEKRVNQWAQAIDNFGKRLNPKSDDVAHWITFGPVAMITFALAIALLVWVVFQEMNDPAVAAWFHQRADAEVTIDPTPLIEVFLLVALKPLLCVGLAAGIYSSRSPEANARVDRAYKWWQEKYRTKNNQMIGFHQAIFDGLMQFAGFAFYLATGLGGLLIEFIFHLIQGPLRLGILILERNQLRRIAACIGLIMLVSAYIIQMSAAEARVEKKNALIFPEDSICPIEFAEINA